MVLSIAGTLQDVTRNRYCTWDVITQRIIVPEDKRDSAEMKARVEVILSGFQIEGASVKIDTFPNGIKYAVIELPKQLGPRTIEKIRERLWNKGQNGISAVIK